MPIRLTESSAREFKKIFSESSMPEGACARITVRGRNKNTLFYRIGIQDRPNNGDETNMSNGVLVAWDARSDGLLCDLEIDFNHRLPPDGGFKFINPNPICADQGEWSSVEDSTEERK